MVRYVRAIKNATGTRIIDLIQDEDGYSPEIRETIEWAVARVQLLCAIANEAGWIEKILVGRKVDRKDCQRLLFLLRRLRKLDQEA